MAEERLGVLRSRFDAAVAAIRELLAGLAPDDWSRVCAAEGWPVVLEGLHIGLGLRRQSGFLDDAFVRGKPAVFRWNETHEMNAQIARRRRPNPRFVVRFVEDQAEQMRQRLAKFTADDLDRTTVDYEGRLLSLDQFIRAFLIGHIEGHTQSIRTALAH